MIKIKTQQRYQSVKEDAFEKEQLEGPCLLESAPSLQVIPHLKN